MMSSGTRPLELTLLSSEAKWYDSEEEMSIPAIKLRKPSKLETEYLGFDVENPRYSSAELTSDRDSDVIEELVKKADLRELVESIASNGYIDIEPLIVTEAKERGVYVVLDGNRRLAAIRLLQDPKLAERYGIPLPEMTPEARGTLDEVTVYAVADRIDAREFIGFKQINGPHRWDALAKGRFAAKWYRRESGQGVTVKDIARQLGDRHDAVKRLVNGIFVLDQAREKRIFSIEDRYPSGRPFAFSHLYTALTRPGFQDYLGLPADWRQREPQIDPVPDEQLDNLRQVLIWLYGSRNEDTPPIVKTQNPDVKQLNKVLQKPLARKILIARRDLREAYELVHTPRDRFETALLNAHQYAEEALSKVSAFDGVDITLIQAAESLKNTTRILHRNMVNAETERASGDVPDAE